MSVFERKISASKYVVDHLKQYAVEARDHGFSPDTTLRHLPISIPDPYVKRTDMVLGVTNGEAIETEGNAMSGPTNGIYSHSVSAPVAAPHPPHRIRADELRRRVSNAYSQIRTARGRIHEIRPEEEIRFPREVRNGSRIPEDLTPIHFGTFFRPNLGSDFPWSQIAALQPEHREDLYEVLQTNLLANHDVIVRLLLEPEARARFLLPENMSIKEIIDTYLYMFFLFGIADPKQMLTMGGSRGEQSGKILHMMQYVLPPTSLSYASKEMSINEEDIYNIYKQISPYNFILNEVAHQILGEEFQFQGYNVNVQRKLSQEDGDEHGVPYGTHLHLEFYDTNGNNVPMPFNIAMDMSVRLIERGQQIVELCQDFQNKYYGYNGRLTADVKATILEEFSKQMKSQGVNDTTIAQLANMTFRALKPTRAAIDSLLESGTITDHHAKNRLETIQKTYAHLESVYADPVKRESEIVHIMQTHSLPRNGAEVILRMMEDTVQKRLDPDGNLIKSKYNLAANFTGAVMFRPQTDDQGFLIIIDGNMQMESINFSVGSTEQGAYERRAHCAIIRETGSK
ncbi:MAG: hypothetical protein WCO06_04585 [Candidatus Roizmanbacteria bacterium]